MIRRDPREDCSVRTHTRGCLMLPFWIFLAFIGGLVIGSLIANAAGVLPNSEGLEREDRARFTKIEESQ
jgi:hypothetical protein